MHFVSIFPSSPGSAGKPGTGGRRSRERGSEPWACEADRPRAGPWFQAGQSPRLTTSPPRLHAAPACGRELFPGSRRIATSFRRSYFTFCRAPPEKRGSRCPELILDRRSSSTSVVTRSVTDSQGKASHLLSFSYGSGVEVPRIRVLRKPAFIQAGFSCGHRDHVPGAFNPKSLDIRCLFLFGLIGP